MSPPSVIQELGRALESYQPQLSIISPRPDELLQDDHVLVRFNLRDLPTFKDPQLGLGPHLHVIVDDLPYQAVYDLTQPLELDLAPGTHTIRAFPARPWHESFKNEGAYAQTTFHVFTRTRANAPNPGKPLLTYSRPQGGYGAEPILLDFYLTNAPLHLVAAADAEDDIADWRIRCTLNGQSFVLDRWQPLYLKGFKPGKNWVQLELLDERGEPIDNVFNNAVRLVTYTPGGQDTLAKLVRAELSAAEARGIVDLTARPTPVEKLPAPQPTPGVVTPPSPEPMPTLEGTPGPEATPEPTPSDSVEVPPAAKKTEESEPESEVLPAPTESKPSFLERIRRPRPAPAPKALPLPEPPVQEEVAEPTPEPTPKLVLPTPEPQPAEPMPELSPPVPKQIPKRYLERIPKPERRLYERTPEPETLEVPEILEAPEVQAVPEGG